MNKQQGFVSIITASILMVMLTLIVLGFSRVMQREQRQALDRQLSAQAFYAAETAVNDLYQRIQTGSLEDQEKTDCDVTDWPTDGANGVINPAEPGVAYTCLQYDQTHEFLEFNNGSITTRESKIFPVQPADGSDVTGLTFEWSGAGGNTTIASGDCSSQPLPTSRPSFVPMLRVDLVRMPTSAPIARDTIINETTTYFLYPKRNCGSSSTPYANHTAVASKGQLINVNCGDAINTGGYACLFTIDQMNLPAANASDRFFARVRSIYADADLRVTGANTSGDFEFLGAQTRVDATGKSTDVLRRVNVSLGNPNYPIPDFVVHSMDGVCKGVEIFPPNANYSCF